METWPPPAGAFGRADAVGPPGQIPGVWGQRPHCRGGGRRPDDERKDLRVSAPAGSQGQAGAKSSRVYSPAGKAARVRVAAVHPDLAFGLHLCCMQRNARARRQQHRQVVGPVPTASASAGVHAKPRADLFSA